MLLARDQAADTVEDGGQVLFELALPHHQDVPTFGNELVVAAHVAGAVAGDLGLPVGGVLAWRGV